MPQGLTLIVNPIPTNPSRVRLTPAIDDMVFELLRLFILILNPEP